MTKVSECPSNASELEKRASEKCSTACGNSERDIKYKYHCVPDSTHKGLYKMCAIPKYLFGNEFFSFLAFSYKVSFQNYLFKMLFAHCENIDVI